MASITQTIKNYTSGISEQSDELKNPGQVSDAVNVMPEVQTGLVKRPGSKFIRRLSDSSPNGTYFHYYRDQNEQYIGQIQTNTNSDPTNGDPKVRIWTLKDIPSIGKKAGDTMVVNYSTTNTANIKQYLEHQNSDELKFLTINDYTYILNRNPRNAVDQVNPCNMTDALTPGWGNADTVNSGDDIIPTGHANFAYIELKKTANARQYSINLNTSGNTTPADVTSAIRIRHKADYPSTTFKRHNGDDWNTWLTNAQPSMGTPNANIQSPNTSGRPFHSRQWFYSAQSAYYIQRHNATCPDIGTAVYSSEDTGGVTDVAIFDENGNPITDGSRKNLRWRFTVKGRSHIKSETGSQPAGPDYICTYDYDVELLHGGEGWKKGDYVRFTADASGFSDGDANGAVRVVYYIEIAEIETTSVAAKIAGVDGDGLIRPAPTSFDADMAVTATTILGGIQDEIGNKLDGCEVIGNGLYLYDANPFDITTPEADLMNIVTDQINDIEKLPIQCKHGMVVKVANSELQEDDYYMRFYGNNKGDGPGAWQECVLPGIRYQIDPNTMPLQLVRQSGGEFMIQQGNYIERQVGNNVTNPKPSFLSRGVPVGESGVLDDRYITNMAFWRNRLVFLSGTNIICSQPGESNITDPNFWAETSLTVSPKDVIDISSSTDGPAKLYETIEVAQGLLVFSENQQWVLATDAEILGPETAKLTAQSTYNFNTSTSPLSLGTTIGFLDNAGKNSKFFEATNLQRGYEPDVLNQTIAVPNLLPKEIDLITNSRENTCVLFGVKGTDTIYGYRYFNSGEKRIQSAWFKWKLDKPVDYMAIIDDLVHVVHTNNNLVRYPLVDKWANWVDEFPIHLDNWSIFTPGTGVDLEYNAADNLTTFKLGGRGFDSDRSVYVFDATPGSDFGRYGIATVSDQNATLVGDWATDGHDLFVGYNFDMEIKLPTIYPQGKGENTSADVNASLVIHRLKLSLGAAGVYETKLERKGKADYTELIETSIQDNYIANNTPWVDQIVHTLPAYERNKNLTVYLKSTHPSPTTLYSMSWEGDYNTKSYQRV